MNDEQRDGACENGERLEDGLASERARRGLAKTIDDYPEEKQAIYRRLLNDGLARARRARETSAHAASDDADGRSPRDGAQS